MPKNNTNYNTMENLLGDPNKKGKSMENKRKNLNKKTKDNTNMNS